MVRETEPMCLESLPLELLGNISKEAYGAPLAFVSRKLRDAVPKGLKTSVMSMIRSAAGATWLVSEGVDTDAIARAIVGAGLVDTMSAFLTDHTDRVELHHGLSVLAAKNGHLAMLDLLLSKGCPMNEDTFVEAAMSGNMEMMEFLLKAGCPWGKRTCSAAAGSGRLEVLRWARENGCPWDDMTCLSAAASGNVDVLQWVVQNGCPIHMWTCRYAAMGGKLDTLRWATDNHFPWDAMTRQWADHHWPGEFH